MTARSMAGWLFIAAVSVACSHSPSRAEPEAATLVGARTLGTVSPVRLADGSRPAVYELLLTNESTGSVRISSVRVLDGDGHEVALLEGASLRASAVSMDAAGSKSRQPDAALSVGGQALVFMFVDLGDTETRTLLHEVAFAGSDGVPHLANHEVELSSVEPVTVAPPIGPGRWLCDGGPSPTSYHRRAALPLDGFHVAQRYAIDFELLAEDGTLARGDPTQLASWHGYEQAVLAAAPLRSEGLPFVIDQFDDLGPAQVVHEAAGRWAWRQGAIDRPMSARLPIQSQVIRIRG